MGLEFEGVSPGGMYQSTAGTSLSRVAHAAAHASKERRLNTPEGRCVSAGGSTVPACGQIHSSPGRSSKGRKARERAGKFPKAERVRKVIKNR